jgi:nucleoside-diphosphate kinase
MNVQRTLFLIKPDAVTKKYTGEILSIILRLPQVKIVHMKMMKMNNDILSKFYHHQVKKDFWNELSHYITSGHVIAVILEGPDVIQQVIDICGPTDPLAASTDTIRRRYGTSINANACHRSDSQESAKREIELLFSKEEIELC